MFKLFSPVLVDHVCNAKAGIDDLAPAVTVEELRAELRCRQMPRARVAVGRVLLDGGDFLARLK